MANYKDTEFNELNGLTIKTVEGLCPGNDQVIFKTECGRVFRMLHRPQICCESVDVDDVCGDPLDLIGYPIILAEEVKNPENMNPKEDSDEFYTWTFYKLATVKGYVTIRWYGVSNGNYSEEVNFDELIKPTQPRPVG